MRIGLIDVDSLIPNIALMKWSAHAKREGHEAELISPLVANTCEGDYDMLVASKIFDFSDMPCLPERTHLGGSGINLEGTLIDAVEHTTPDYSLYNCDYAMGYSSRGCNHKCPWCIVPEKEGRWHFNADLGEFWTGQKKLMLLDNSINADEEHFCAVCDRIIAQGIQVDFSQGLDIRLFSSIQARKLAQLEIWKYHRFAWDSMGNEGAVRKGISILEKHGLVKNRKTMFYVLIGFNTTPEEDLYRVEVLRDLGVNSFVMPYNKFDYYQKHFTRWVNHKATFHTVAWKDYKWYKPDRIGAIQ